MAPAPMRARGVERALEGRALDEASVAQALARAVEDIAPATDAIATAWYRREVLPVHLGRLLRPRGAA
jgi:CO/xanthine dehydrogenase FAD-binding subunit